MQHAKVCKQVGFGSWTGLHRKNVSFVNHGDVYQFGVSVGKTLTTLVQIYHGRQFWGFDTFTGLPPEESGEPIIDQWRPGAFSTGGRRNIPNITKRVGGNVKLIPGLFNNTLTTEMGREMRNAVYIDVDSDLYSSSWQALDWIFKHNIAVPGTVIGYDDFWVLPCARKDPHIFQYGEAKAHRQISRKYRVVFRCICGPCVPHEEGKAWGWRSYFVVESIGQRIDHGFEMTTSDANHYILNAGICRNVWDRKSARNSRG